MTDWERVTRILAQQQVESYGVCPFPARDELLPCRNAEHLPQNPQAVLVCAFSYYTDPSIPSNLCLYARVPDYHQVVRGILNGVMEQLRTAFPAHRFAGFTDVSALPERLCALRAGLGVLGKNGMVIHPTYGSFFVIGEIVTDLPLPFSQPRTGGCQNCGRCIQSCPSGALSEKGFCEEKCLSAVTQRKGELTPEEEDKIRKGGLVWGCDRCQLVCPHNQHLKPTAIAAFADHLEPVVTRENLSALRKTRAFGYRSKALMLRNLALFEEECP